MLIEQVLKRLIKSGDLLVTDHKGHGMRFGDGTGRAVHIHFKTAKAERAIALDPDLYLGECYMNGSLAMKAGTIYDFLALAMANTSTVGSVGIHRFLDKLRIIFRRLSQHNPVGRAKRNVAHHYDLSGQLYDLFLDVDRQYSCAYFETEN